MPLGTAIVAGGAQNTSQTIGNTIPNRAGQLGDLIVSQLQGLKYEGTYRGNRYSVANQAAVTTTAALSTTFTGLVVGNPASSPVNLVLDKFAAAQFAVGAAGAIGLMGGASTTVITGTLTVQNRKMGGSVGYGVASAGQTIGTPILLDVFGSIGSVATSSIPLVNGICVDLNGSLIIPPGYFVASYTTIVTTSALIFSIGWAEVPI
jgi:hypothetical protein